MNGYEISSESKARIRAALARLQARGRVPAVTDESLLHVRPIELAPWRAAWRRKDWGTRFNPLVAALYAVGLFLIVPDTSRLAPMVDRDVEEVWRTLDISNGLTRIAFGAWDNAALPAAAWRGLNASDAQILLFANRDLPAISAPSANFGTPLQPKGYAALRRSTPFVALAKNRAPGPVQTMLASASELWSAHAADSRPARKEDRSVATIIGPAGRELQFILLDAPEGLSDEQAQWLVGELQKKAELRLILAPFPVLADAGDDEPSVRRRARLIGVIKEAGANGVVFLSHDAASGAVYRAGGILSYPLFELSCSSISALPNGATTGSVPHRLGPGFQGRSFGFVAIDWVHKVAHLEVRDSEGQVLEPVASVPFGALNAVSTSVAGLEAAGSGAGGAALGQSARLRANPAML